jgi:hypothetical protein
MTPAFAEYPQTLDDAALMPGHAKAREKVFVPVRPSSFTGSPDSVCSTSRGNHLRPRPPANPAPWLVMIAAGALLIAAGLVRMRRPA